MSRARPDRKPLIALVHNADKAFQAHMVRSAHERGRPDIKRRTTSCSRSWATRVTVPPPSRCARITRQSMGEVIRDLVDLGILEMAPDPHDGRAKIVRYTPEGKRFAREGFRHLRDLEGRFEQEFGADYEAARMVLERVVGLLGEKGQG